MPEQIRRAEIIKKEKLEADQIWELSLLSGNSSQIFSLLIRDFNDISVFIDDSQELLTPENCLEIYKWIPMRARLSDVIPFLLKKISVIDFDFVISEAKKRYVYTFDELRLDLIKINFKTQPFKCFAAFLDIYPNCVLSKEEQSIIEELFLSVLTDETDEFRDFMLGYFTTLGEDISEFQSKNESYFEIFSNPENIDMLSVNQSTKTIIKKIYSKVIYKQNPRKYWDIVVENNGQIADQKILFSSENGIITLDYDLIVFIINDLLTRLDDSDFLTPENIEILQFFLRYESLTKPKIGTEQGNTIDDGRIYLGDFGRKACKKLVYKMHAEPELIEKLNDSEIQGDLKHFVLEILDLIKGINSKNEEYIDSFSDFSMPDNEINDLDIELALKTVLDLTQGNFPQENIQKIYSRFALISNIRLKCHLLILLLPYLEDDFKIKILSQYSDKTRSSPFLNYDTESLAAITTYLAEVLFSLDNLDNDILKIFWDTLSLIPKLPNNTNFYTSYIKILLIYSNPLDLININSKIEEYYNFLNPNQADHKNNHEKFFDAVKKETTFHNLEDNFINFQSNLELILTINNPKIQAESFLRLLKKYFENNPKALSVFQNFAFIKSERLENNTENKLINRFYDVYLKILKNSDLDLEIRNAQTDILGRSKTNISDDSSNKPIGSYTIESDEAQENNFIDYELDFEIDW